MHENDLLHHFFVNAYAWELHSMSIMAVQMAQTFVKYYINFETSQSGYTITSAKLTPQPRYEKLLQGLRVGDFMG